MSPTMKAVSFVCTMMAAVSHVKVVSSFLAPRMAATSMYRLHMSTPVVSTEDSTPPTAQQVHISIEYCSGCQWMLRSTWIASEILTTFANDASLTSISLIPKGPPLSEGGIFRITANTDSNKNTLLWDRKIEGRFPESKEVKQLIRDLVDPCKNLGHSDKQKGDVDSSSKEAACAECQEQQEDEQKEKSKETNDFVIPDIFYEENKVSIEYSTGSVSSPDNGLYRANFYTNELLSCAYERNAWWKRFQKDSSTAGAPVIMMDTVTLLPNRELNGMMKIQLNEEMIIYDHSTETEDEYIDASNLRKMVTNAIMYGDTNLNSSKPAMEVMDDDEAEEARKYFGVF